MLYQPPGSGSPLWVRWTEQRDRVHPLLHPQVQEWRTATHSMTTFGAGFSTNCDYKVESKPANKRTQEPTLASKMDRVVSICCMRRDMLASFCRKEEKMCEPVGAADAKERRQDMHKPLHKL